MAEPIDFPNTVLLVRNYLDGLLSIPVVTRVPDPRPEQWVQLRRTGGQKLLVRDQVNITFTSWDSEDENRCALNLAAVRSLVHELQRTTVLGPMVYQVEETAGPFDDADEQSGDFTFWFSADVFIRAD